MTRKILSVLTLLVLANDISGQYPEKEKWPKTVYEELHDVRVSFTGKAPYWLNGTLIRVAPAAFEMGKNRESFVTSDLDGFAKLAQWKFYGNNTALFSTVFVRSTYYNESWAKQKFTSTIFMSPPYPDLTPEEKNRSREVGIDNMDIAIAVCPDPNARKGHVVATTDVLSVYPISMEDLSTGEKANPIGIKTEDYSRSDVPLFTKILSTAHPLPDPKYKDSLINVLIEASLEPGKFSVMKLIRIKSLKQSEIIASWTIPEVLYIHSFSLSEKKAIILMNPYIVNMTCKLNIDWGCYKPKEGNESITLYVVDLENGSVRNMKVPKVFVLHNINAYDQSDDTVIADVATYRSPHIFGKLAAPRDERNPSEEAVMQRITIFLANNTASMVPVPTPTNVSHYTSKLDYPTINEASQSKPYCYVYGVVKSTQFNYGPPGIAKKDLCGSAEHSKDAIFARQEWIPHEPIFVASPNARAEDDGILLVPVTDTRQQKTHLALLDARDLSFLDLAEGPLLIPVGQHGKYLEHWQWY